MTGLVPKKASTRRLEYRAIRGPRTPRLNPEYPECHHIPALMLLTMEGSGFNRTCFDVCINIHRDGIQDKPPLRYIYFSAKAVEPCENHML